jgi:hypothetical protein
MNRRGWLIVVVILAVVTAGAGVAVGGVFDRAGGSGGSVDNGSATALATVERRSLSAQMQVTGTLGYAGSYTVLGQAPGTVTWLPAVGQVVGEGQMLYRLDGAPVVLLYGSSPAYRALAAGTTGLDVAQLNRDLVRLGYLDSSDVDSHWSRFNGATRAGVKKLQNHLGVEQSGTLPLGAVVFLPTAARVTALQVTLGAPAAGPLLQASSTLPVVTVALTADLQSTVKTGDRVTITLPDGRSTPGTVASVGKVATVASGNPGGGGNSGPTVPVTIRPTDPAATGGLDQAPVLVAITTTTVHNVLAVPVYALLATAGGGTAGGGTASGGTAGGGTAGGGYAVEVVDPGGARRLVPVAPGLFDDATGLVQVTGAGLAEGLRVVVPVS